MEFVLRRGCLKKKKKKRTEGEGTAGQKQHHVFKGGREEKRICEPECEMGISWTLGRAFQLGAVSSKKLPQNFCNMLNNSFIVAAVYAITIFIYSIYSVLIIV